MLKKALQLMLKRLFRPAFIDCEKAIADVKQSLNTLSQIEQRRLSLFYKQLAHEKKLLPAMHDVGFRLFSQNDEDGILLYIFSLIGTTNKKCLDIAFASPYGANTTNLICNWNWSGLLICGDTKEAETAQAFFTSNKDTFLSPVAQEHL